MINVNESSQISTHTESRELLDEIKGEVIVETAGEELVCDLMQDVVEEATELMINRHLDRVAVPYTVRCVTREMLDFIHCAFVGQDRGDVRTEGWAGGRKPEAVSVDSWARGAVDVKTKPRPIATSDSKAQSGHLGHDLVGTARLRTKGSSMSSGIEKKLSKYDQQRRDGGSSEGHREDSGLGDKSKSTLNRLTVKNRRGVAGGNNKDLSGGKSGVQGENAEGLEGEGEEVQLSQEEIDYANKIKADLKKKHDTKQLAERLTKQMEEMKNVKDIVVDGTTGKVIAVKQFDGRSVPNEKNTRKADLKFQVSPDEVIPSAAGKGGAAASRRGIPGGATGGATGTTGGGRKRTDASAFVQEENQHGPMIEGVMPSGGVVVKEGDATRRSDLKIPKTKLSRTEYKKMVDTVHVNIDLDGLGEDELGNGRKDSAAKVAGKARINDYDGGNNIASKDTKAMEDLKKRELSALRRHSNAGQQQQAEYKSQKAAHLPSHSVSSTKKGGGMLGAQTRGGHGKDLKLTANAKSQALGVVHDLEDRDRKSRVGMVVHQEAYFDDDDDEDETS